MPLPRIEVRHLGMLRAIADGGSLTRAAQRLFVTQSALSHQLKSLEGACGVELVERESRPLRFTPAGQRLLELAQQLLPQVADAERDLARLREGRAGPLRIAVECHTCFDWLMPAMDAFRPRWPEVELDLVSGFQTDPLPLLLKGQADFAVIHDEPAARRGVVFHRLFEYETVALLCRGHRLAGRKRLEAKDFAQETLITYPVEDAKLDLMRHLLLPAGIRPRATRRVELTVAILQLVASGRGIAALPEWSVAPYLARGYVEARPIGRKGLRCALYGATTAALAETAYVREFVELIRGAGGPVMN
ncbi:MAG: LysR substrate-binding domain-containing protein [Nevskia sp.]|nr:LysR substrate-binding domain-containing protein [Nevskia sp.]